MIKVHWGIIRYRCRACRQETRLYRNWHGRKPRGGFACPHCGATIMF